MVAKITQMLNMMYPFYFCLYLEKTFFMFHSLKKLKLGSLYHIALFLNTEKVFALFLIVKMIIHTIKSTIV